MPRTKKSPTPPPRRKPAPDSRQEPRKVPGAILPPDLEARVKALEEQASRDRKTIVILSLRTMDVFVDMAQALQDMLGHKSPIVDAVRPRIPEAEWYEAFEEWEGLIQDEVETRRPA